MVRIAGIVVAVGAVLAACGGDGGLATPGGGDGGGADGGEARAADSGGESRADAGPGDAASGDAASLSDAALALTSFEGIYAIDDVTLNESSCASEGSSVLGDQTSTLFVAVAIAFGSSASLSLVACTDVLDCKDKATMERGGSVSGADWVYGVSGTGSDNSADTVTVALPNGGMCAGELLERATLTGTPRGTLRISVMITDVPTHPAAGDNCDFAATETAATGVPCARLKVITGSFQQAL